MKSFDKLTRFMSGFTAAVQLLNRAGEHGFFVEYVVLSASVIDANLRIGITLKHQLQVGSNELIDDLLEQPEESRGYNERQIYKRALKEGVIQKDLFDELEALYQRRNRVIHRYIISRITTDQVLDIAIEYERMITRSSADVELLEREQINRRVGMTVEGPSTPRGLLDELAEEKHASRALAQVLKLE